MITHTANMATTVTRNGGQEEKKGGGRKRRDDARYAEAREIFYNPEIITERDVTKQSVARIKFLNLTQIPV